jgi:hypothetical protein
VLFTTVPRPNQRHLDLAQPASPFGPPLGGAGQRCEQP